MDIHYCRTPTNVLFVPSVVIQHNCNKNSIRFCLLWFSRLSSKPWFCIWVMLNCCLHWYKTSQILWDDKVAEVFVYQTSKCMHDVIALHSPDIFYKNIAILLGLQLIFIAILGAIKCIVFDKMLLSIRCSIDKHYTISVMVWCQESVFGSPVVLLK